MADNTTTTPAGAGAVPPKPRVIRNLTDERQRKNAFPHPAGYGSGGLIALELYWRPQDKQGT